MRLRLIWRSWSRVRPQSTKRTTVGCISRTSLLPQSRTLPRTIPLLHPQQAQQHQHRRSIVQDIRVTEPSRTPYASPHLSTTTTQLSPFSSRFGLRYSTPPPLTAPQPPPEIPGGSVVGRTQDRNQHIWSSRQPKNHRSPQTRPSFALPQPPLIFPCSYSPVLLNLFFFLSSRTRTAALTLPDQSLIPLFCYSGFQEQLPNRSQTPPVESSRHPNSWLNLLGSTLYANLNPVFRDQVSATKQDNSLHSP